jgi:hypothetical protein
MSSDVRSAIRHGSRFLRFFARRTSGTAQRYGTRWIRHSRQKRSWCGMIKFLSRLRSKQARRAFIRLSRLVRLRPFDVLWLEYFSHGCRYIGGPNSLAWESTLHRASLLGCTDWLAASPRASGTELAHIACLSSRKRCYLHTPSHLRLGRWLGSQSAFPLS